MFYNKMLNNIVLGLRKCREIWPNIDYERGYNILLDVLLLVLPLVVLTATYLLITRTLWRGIRTQNTNLSKY